MNAPLRLTVTGAVATGLAAVVLTPVVEGGGWLARSLLAVALVAAVGHGARLLRMPALLVPLSQLAALVILLTAMFAGGEAGYGLIPGDDAVAALRTTVERGVDTINGYAAPVPATSGVLLIVMSGVGLIAVLVDLVAAGLRHPALSGLPLLALYSVPATTLPGGLSGLLFLFPAAGFLAVLLADGRDRLIRWGRPFGSPGWDATASGAAKGGAVGSPGPVVDASPAAVVQLGRRIGLTVLGIATIVPALVPLSEGILAGGRFGAGEGSGTIATLNPLVSLRRDLSRPRDVEVLRVRTNAAAPRELYLRTVTLDVFDGQDWRSSSRRVQRLEEELPPAPGISVAVTREAVRSQIQVTRNLESDYVPLPYPARRLEISGDWRVDAATQNVVSHHGRRQISGRSYTVDSSTLKPLLAQLQGGEPAPRNLGRYLELPELPETVTQLAEQIVADAETPFEKALAIQNYLRENFSYDLQVRPGTGTPAIIDFLDDKRGYCEQFASTMAIFARLARLPARVNVGFTSGDLRPDGTLAISAHDAHAWPEVYLSGVGWMRFEPTPGGSASPSVPSWLGVTAPGTSPAPESSAPAAPSTAQPTGRVDPRECTGARALREECAGVVPDGSGAGDNGRWPWGLPMIPVALLVGVAWIAVLPATVHLVVRRRRWARADDALRHAEAAWADVRDAAIDLGYGWDEAETPRQAAARLTREAGLHRRNVQALSRITRAVERARYSEAPDLAADLRPEARLVHAALATRADRRDRLRARLAPRSARLALHRAGDRAADAMVRLDRAGARLRRRLLGDPLRRLAGRGAGR